RAKDIEILVLRHQLTVLQRKVTKPVFTREDRFLLAGLLHRLPMGTLRRLTLLVRPDTILRRHRDLLRRRHAAASAHRRRGRPRTVRSIRVLVLRPARENSSWGYRRIHGELAALGSKVAASTVWEVLKAHGIDPSPEREHTAWSEFLRSQADALPACDFFEVRTLTGARLYVLAVIEHATRRIRILGVTAHPTGQWVTQLGRNLVMDLQDAGSSAKFLIRDRDTKFIAAFDAVPAGAGVRIIKSGVRMPRMNSIMERWIQTCRRELLDRTLIWNQRHLLHVLREFETFYNEHRPHRALQQAAPLRPLVDPGIDSASIASLEIRRRDRLGGVLKEYRHAA
ncbi:integrase core domain-containing protein, partial [Nonomuraea sp. NPDC046570]|uniref:integrase core domain-containing protein n=1 Tax=Nonomuraea sp. NPDC046570 TaxID=3155255 RepID=UPI0033C19A71